MVFDDQPLFTQNIVDTQMTPVDTVRKENVWHPLKTMKFNPSFKPIIYVITLNNIINLHIFTFQANDPELPEMADGEN